MSPVKPQLVRSTCFPSRCGLFDCSQGLKKGACVVLKEKITCSETVSCPQRLEPPPHMWYLDFQSNTHFN